MERSFVCCWDSIVIIINKCSRYFDIPMLLVLLHSLAYYNVDFLHASNLDERRVLVPTPIS